MDDYIRYDYAYAHSDADSEAGSPTMLHEIMSDSDSEPSPRIGSSVFASSSSSSDDDSTTSMHCAPRSDRAASVDQSSSRHHRFHHQAEPMDRGDDDDDDDDSDAHGPDDGEFIVLDRDSVVSMIESDQESDSFYTARRIENHFDDSPRSQPSTPRPSDAPDSAASAFSSPRQETTPSENDEAHKSQRSWTERLATSIAYHHTDWSSPP